MQFGSVVYLVTVHNDMKKAERFQVWEKDKKPSTSRYQSRIMEKYWAIYWTHHALNLIVLWNIES